MSKTIEEAMLDPEWPEKLCAKIDERVILGGRISVILQGLESSVQFSIATSRMSLEELKQFVNDLENSLGRSH